MWNTEIFVSNITIPCLSMKFPVSNLSTSQDFLSPHYLVCMIHGLYKLFFFSLQTTEGTYNLRYLRWFYSWLIYSEKRLRRYECSDQDMLFQQLWFATLSYSPSTLQLQVKKAEVSSKPLVCQASKRTIKNS